jgi:pilus assembly protein CpaE
MSLIVVAGADDAFLDRVRSALAGPLFDTVEEWEGALDDAAVKEIADRRPAVVVLGAELDAEDAFAVAATLDRRSPSISVLVHVEDGPDAWRSALAAGVRGLITEETTDEELASMLDQAVLAAQAQTGVAGESTSLSRVITVVSPKGGAGKTVLATNLAVGLGACAPRDVVLVDLDLQFGDAAYAMMLSPTHTIADAVSVVDDLDATTLKVFLTRHASGVFVLCAPEDAAAGEEISADSVAAILGLLASEFRFVVIDTGAGLSEHTLVALEQSTDIVLISDMDVPSVRNLRKAVVALDLLGMTSQDRRFVLNRADSKVGLSKEDVSNAAGMSVDDEIPSSRHIPVALNEGQPLLLKNPRLPASKCFARLAAHFADATTREVTGKIRR